MQAIVGTIDKALVGDYLTKALWKRRAVLRRKRLISRPTKNQDIRFEELNEAELSNEWQDKARALQLRRWKALKHELKRGVY